MDGEAGVTANSSKQHFLEKGINLHIRAKDMHARYIERRGKLFRDVIHKIDSEMRSRAHYLPLERIVAEAVFCGNALLTVNGSTPYNAVYGRVPHILPGIDQIETPAAAPQGSFLRGVHLLREVSVAAMVEGSAKARLNRALNTRSTVSAANLDLKVGDEVDFYREPTTKDVSGWYGPGKVSDTSMLNRGMVTVRHLRNFYEVALNHIRKHLTYWVFLTSDDARPHTTYRTVWNEMRRLVNDMPRNTTEHLGPYKEKGNLANRATTVKGSSRSRLLCAIRFFGENHLQLGQVISARVGHGVRILHGVTGYSRAVTMFWSPHNNAHRFLEQTADDKGRIAATNIGHLTELWPQMRCVRFHLAPEECGIAIKVEEPSARPAGDPADGEPSATVEPNTGALSPIPEGTEPDDESYDSHSTLLSMFYEHNDSDLQRILEQTLVPMDDWPPRCAEASGLKPLRPPAISQDHPCRRHRASSRTRTLMKSWSTWSASCMRMASRPLPHRRIMARRTTENHREQMKRNLPTSVTVGQSGFGANRRADNPTVPTGLPHLQARQVQEVREQPRPPVQAHLQQVLPPATLAGQPRGEERVPRLLGWQGQRRTKRLRERFRSTRKSKGQERQCHDLPCLWLDRTLRGQVP